MFYVNEWLVKCVFIRQMSAHKINLCHLIMTWHGYRNHLSWGPGQVKFQSGQACIFKQCPADK